MKKTEFITFRTDQSTKASLTNIAAKKKWTISLLAEEIIKDFIHRYPDDTAEKTAERNNREDMV